MLQASETLDDGRRMDEAGGEYGQHGTVHQQRIKRQAATGIEQRSEEKKGGKRYGASAHSGAIGDKRPEQPSGDHNSGQRPRAAAVVPQPRVGERK